MINLLDFWANRCRRNYRRSISIGWMPRAFLILVSFLLKRGHKRSFCAFGFLKKRDDKSDKSKWPRRLIPPYSGCNYFIDSFYLCYARTLMLFRKCPSPKLVSWNNFFTNSNLNHVLLTQDMFLTLLLSVHGISVFFQFFIFSHTQSSAAG